MAPATYYADGDKEVLLAMAAKHPVDRSLQSRLSDEDWAEYQRLTGVANGPGMRDLPVTRAVYIVGFSVMGLLVAGMIITLAAGSRSWTALMVAAVVVMLVTLVAPIFTVFPESMRVRARAAAARQALADSAPPPETPHFESTSDWSPSFPVTGTYNPGLYMRRGGPEYKQWLKDTGYGDHETYEANKPD